MTVPIPAPAQDAVERLDRLTASLAQVGRAVLPIEEVRLAFDSWGFERAAPIDPNASPDATFHVHPAYTHLQMNVVGTGLAHPALIDKAIGLIRSLRVHL